MDTKKPPKYGVMLLDLDSLRFEVIGHLFEEDNANRIRKEHIALGKPAYMFEHCIYRTEEHSGGGSKCNACVNDADAVVSDLRRRKGNEDKLNEEPF